MNVSCRCYFLIRDKVFNKAYCRSNLQRNKNVVPRVITKFLKLVSKCYKTFYSHHHIISDTKRHVSKRKWKKYRCNSKAKPHRRRSTLTLLIMLIKPCKTFIPLSLSDFPLYIKLHQNMETNKIKYPS